MAAVGIDHRIAATIGEHQIDPGEGLVQRVIGGLPQFGERCRRIHVPEDFQGPWAGMAKDFLEQKIVLEADAACLDDHIGLAAAAATIFSAVDRAFIDDDLAPFRRIDVAVLLPVVDVGLVEGDVVALLASARSRPR
jgi:hypothetical protein